MHFYKSKRHSSAPQIFKESILSNRTGKTEQYNPSFPITQSGHRDTSLEIGMRVSETAVSTQSVKFEWHLPVSVPLAMTGSCRGNRKSWSLLDRSEPQPFNSKMELCLHWKSLCQIQEKLTLEQQGMDSPCFWCGWAPAPRLCRTLYKIFMTRHHLLQREGLLKGLFREAKEGSLFE